MLLSQFPLTYHDLHQYLPGATSSRAFGINKDHKIVGLFTDTVGTHGFMLDFGLGPPSSPPTVLDYHDEATVADETWAFGITDDGLIV